MKSLFIGFIAFIILTSIVYAQTESKNSLWFVSSKSCLVYKDTIGISLGDQQVIAIRYSGMDRDSINCYVLSKMPEVAKLTGANFFYNFAASLMLRSLLWSKKLSSVFGGQYSNQPYQGFDPSKDMQLDSVWADVEGMAINVRNEPNVEAIGNRHDMTDNKEDFYNNKQLDAFLLRNAGLKERPEGGWLHFSFRLMKKQ